MTDSLGNFAKSVYPFIDLRPFHENYYRLLQAFADGRVRRLMITMPPQHGKSLGASVLLPAYLLGLDPDRRIALASYSASLASRFNRRVQRLIESPEYAALFPDTAIKKSGSSKNTASGSYIRTSDHVEIIGRDGELFSVGRDGPLTGNRVDTFILDDLYRFALFMNDGLTNAGQQAWFDSEWLRRIVEYQNGERTDEVIADPCNPMQ